MGPVLGSRMAVPVSSGIPHIDRFLGGLQPGDNVVWVSETGTSVHAFVKAFVRAAPQGEPGGVVYVNCNYAPQSIYRRFAEGLSGTRFVHVDAFTNGKGKSDTVFKDYYEALPDREGFETVCMKNPSDTGEFYSTLAAIEQDFQEGARYVVDSLTGLSELWGGGRAVQEFFTNQCPKLYELQAVAYWILEKEAHPRSFLAALSHITQVVVQLGCQEQGVCQLKVLKAEDRPSRLLNEAMHYRVEGELVEFTEASRERPIPVGERIREERIARNLSQAELARMVDITPSALCQIEANQVYPSLPLLLDIAGVLGLSLDSLFKGLRHDSEASAGYVVYKKKDQTARRDEKAAKGAAPVEIVPLLPLEDGGPRIAPYLLRIGAGRQGTRSFFDHKGPEFGWVLNGLIRVTLEGREVLLRKGDSVYVERGTIKKWRNEGPGKAEVLWVLL